MKKIEFINYLKENSLLIVSFNFTKVTLKLTFYTFVIPKNLLSYS